MIGDKCGFLQRYLTYLTYIDKADTMCANNTLVSLRDGRVSLNHHATMSRYYNTILRSLITLNSKIYTAKGYCDRAFDQK